MNDHAAVSIEIGLRVKAMREARGLSLRGLSALSQISPNALSHIERGQVSPSVSTLNRVAGALGVPITAFFETGPARQAVVLVRAGERTRVPFLRGLMEGLGGERFAGRVEPFHLTLETGGNSGPHPVTHTGHEFVHVLRGRLEYLLEKDAYLLEAGDSLLFAAHLQHRWRNAGKTVVNALIIISSFDEGEQPRNIHRPVDGGR